MPYIYIMTNPAYEGYVKIGSTDKNPEDRRKELSNPPGVMFPFEIYAYYETEKSLEDKVLHKIIDKINPQLRVNKRREFYEMKPEDAYEMLEGIAQITNTENKITLVAENISANIKAKQIKPKFSFKSASITEGSILQFTENNSIEVKVIGDGQKNIEYNNEKYSLSELAKILLDSKYPVQGTLYFTFEGETLNDRRLRLEAADQYK